MNHTGVDAARIELIGRFSWIDYVVFGAMLLLSAGIGIFYGCFGKKMKDTKEFLMAGKSMTTFPVAMSLIASFMSAITLLGTPSEVYSTGFIYWLIGFSYFIVMPAAAYLYLPVFYELQVTSAYEYLELRFHKYVRMLGSLVFIIQMSLYMAIVVYAPALALSQVTGINVYLSVSLICFVCIFYTTLGGMKAVLWTDALQVVIMYGVMMFIIIKGTIDQGGFSHVWEVAKRGGRATLVDWDPDPTIRHSFWTLIVGGYFTWITIYGVNQAQVQRYLCVKEKRMAINALWINMIGLFILMITCAFGGLVLYTKYETCAPLESKLVKTSDQLLPLFVMDTLGHLKGLPGLFVAGIFSGALSTVSSGMNSLAAITLEDFVKGGCFPNISEKNATITSKVLSLLFGVLTFALVFVAEQLGDILSAALSIFGMVGGPLCGVFTLGMFFPWANAKGAFTGTIAGLAFTFWIGIGFQVSKYKKWIQPYKLPVITEGCAALNFTLEQTSIIAEPIVESDSSLMNLYKISYLWYSAVGVFTVIIVGLIVSALTGPQDIKTLNPNLLSPLVHWTKRIIPGGSLIGINYDPDELARLKNKSGLSLGGLSTVSMGTVNMGYSENLPPVKNGHIDNIEASSKL